MRSRVPPLCLFLTLFVLSACIYVCCLSENAEGTCSSVMTRQLCHCNKAIISESPAWNSSCLQHKNGTSSTGNDDISGEAASQTENDNGFVWRHVEEGV